MRRANLCVLSCLHDDHWFVKLALSSCQKAGPILAFVNQKAWNGEKGDWQRCADAAKEAGAEVILGSWEDETDHRRFAFDEAKRRGFTHAILPDGDEVLDPQLCDSLIAIAKGGIAERVYVHMDTYWKSARYVIRPRERYTPVIMVDLEKTHHYLIRDYRGGRAITLDPDYGVFHHLSYAGPDERIERKLLTWSHREEVQPDWLRNVWRAWDSDPFMTKLHPTVPIAYGFAERIEIPEVLAGVWDERPVATDPPIPRNWPTLSIVIPLHGGETDIRACLESLAKCNDLVSETVVVDDKSPDNAPEVASDFEFVRLVKNQENLGFAATCNRGFEESSGEVVVFLNSDTIVPRSGLIRLVESLVISGTVGAVGPYTNNAGYAQKINTTYTDVKNLDGFATNFSHQSLEDKDVPMLVGFCLAVRRSVLQEVGLFDTRFGKGLFEDNDLCYRIQRAGYKLRISSRSYVHHEGSKSLARMSEPAELLLARNLEVFKSKWREDLESGFASHLPGLGPDLIQFQKELHPDTVKARAVSLASKADISLCMIVRDEERVIRDCLTSAAPFFSQVIVVDTGSSDRTPEICRELGAEVYDMTWPESFSVARNESLKHAKGKWIFWLDADDTLPTYAGEAILQAALYAPPEIVGFIVPVQFVEDGPGAGTRVDHVKLFRNIPGLTFEGRIHEQILASLRPHGEIARVSRAIVLHSGYDTSVEGQQKKRARDEKLLKLDLNERPDHPFVLFNLGMTAHYCGDHRDAISWFRKCIDKSGANDSHVRKAFALLGASHRYLGDLNSAIASFAEGTAKVGPDPELDFQCAMTLFEKGRLVEAKEKYLAMPLDISGFFSSIDIGILGYKRSANLGRICLNLGDYQGAKEWLLKAYDENPRVQETALDVVNAALEREDYRTAQATLDKIRQRSGPTQEWADIQARMLELRGQSVEDFLQHTASVHPAAIGPRLVLARRMLQSGLEREAAVHLEILDGLGCAEAAYFRGISATRLGDFPKALVHMERALKLNPAHEPTLQQVTALRTAVSA